MAYTYETEEYKKLQRKFQQLERYYTDLKKENEELKTKIKELQKWQKYPNDKTKTMILKLEKENEKMKQVLKDIATVAAPFKGSMDNLKI